MKSCLNISESFLRTLGILNWGYTEEALPHSFAHYENWVSSHHHGTLGYLADERKDLRSDLRKVYPEFQSALVFLFGYQESKKWMLENQQHEVAGYSLGFEGEDYHYALKKRLDQVFQKLQEERPELGRFISLDAQPVLERDLAHRAGLGWYGKNSMLINQQEGSYFIIGSLLLNQRLNIEINSSDIDHCGQCNACVEACPTRAIDPETRTILANQCISNFTIEVFKEAEAPVGFENSRGEIFGCDICQDVCPWNKKTLTKVQSKLSLLPQLSFLKEWFYEIPKISLKKIITDSSNRGLKKKLVGTPFDRPGRIGWLKNFRKD